MRRVGMTLLLMLLLCSCVSTESITPNIPYTKHSGQLLSIVETDNETQKGIKTLYFLTIDHYTPPFNKYAKYEGTYNNSSSSRIIGYTANTHIFRQINEDNKESIGLSDLNVNQIIEIWVAPNQHNEEFLDAIEITVLTQ